MSHWLQLVRCPVPGALVLVQIEPVLKRPTTVAGADTVRHIAHVWFRQSLGSAEGHHGVRDIPCHSNRRSVRDILAHSDRRSVRDILAHSNRRSVRDIPSHSNRRSVRDILAHSNRRSVIYILAHSDRRSVRDMLAHSNRHSVRLNLDPEKEQVRRSLR